MKKLYWPVIGVILMAALNSIQAAMSDNHIGAQEWVQVALGVLMAFNVWATANLPQYEHMKGYVAGAIAVVSALYTFVIGGVSLPELINLAVIALSAAGVVLTGQPLTRVINGTTIGPDESADATSA